MGYDVHITRKATWFQDGPDILPEEWLACVENDPELRLAGIAEAPLPNGRVLQYRNPLLAEWTGYSSGSVVWIDFRKGRASVKNPDAEIIEKMKEIAHKLRARVQGDEEEFY